jgi:hypothetical protein
LTDDQDIQQRDEKIACHTGGQCYAVPQPGTRGNQADVHPRVQQKQSEQQRRQGHLRAPVKEMQFAEGNIPDPHPERRERCGNDVGCNEQPDQAIVRKMRYPRDGRLPSFHDVRSGPVLSHSTTA